MLASELLLAAFTGSWLIAQYREEEQRLHTDLEVVFNKTRDSVLNAALDKEVSALLRDSTSPDGKQVKLQFSFTTGSGNDMPPIPTGSKGSIKAITIVRNSGDSAPRVSFQTQALRTAVARTMKADDVLYKNFQSSMDSMQFTEAFKIALQKKNNRLAAVNTSAPGHDSIFVFTTSEAHNNFIKVEGYEPFLLKQILPQMGFSLLLLLLSGLTFMLAYRNMRRQQRFSKQKDNFISNISHELKTPVATTKVALEALSNYNALEDPRRSKQYLQMATWEMDRLEQLVNSVLNTIQSEQGMLQLHKEPMDLNALIREITQGMVPLMEEKQVNFTLHTPANPVIVTADKIHLRGAFYNLIDNALKYGGPVFNIGISIEEYTAQVSIWDNGKGIPAVYHSQVFEKFFRVPQGNKHDVKGHGLGLSYARYAIQAHKGSIRLTSSADQGTAFMVSLPLTDPS